MQIAHTHNFNFKINCLNSLCIDTPPKGDGTIAPTVPPHLAAKEFFVKTKLIKIL